MTFFHIFQKGSGYCRLALQMDNYNVIESVVPGSIADEAGFEPGDILLKINGHIINDILEDCTAEELKSIAEVIKTTKSVLRKK